jgi:hypothetical protein
MPVDVRLSDNKKYLIYTMDDPLGINELMQAYSKERDIRDSIPYQLSSMVDMSQVRGIPRNWLTAKAGPGLTHPRSGAILIVGVSRALMALVNIIFSIARYDRVQFFDTYEEAEAKMQELTKDIDVNAQDSDTTGS